MKVTKKLTEGNIYKNYLSYSIPLMLSSLVASLYSTVDAVIAGKCIGEFALGAVSASGSFEGLFNALFNGFAGGFAVYIAQLFGRNDGEKIKRDTYSTTLFVIALSIGVGVLAILFRNPILDYLNVDPILREDAETYFVITMGGCFFNYVNLVLVNVLYSVGVTSVALYVSIGSAVLNVAGNLLTVMVFDMGVAGIAISTVFATACVTGLYLYMLGKVYREIAPEKKPFRLSFAGIRNSARYTIPAAVQKVAFCGVTFLIAPAINGLGAAATTANNVATRIYVIATTSIWQVTSAAACYTAQCVGEEDCGKIPKGMRAGFRVNLIFLIPILLIFVLFATPIVSIFFPEGYTGEAVEYSVRYIYFYLPFVLLQMEDHLLHSYMRSLGQINAVLWISVFSGALRTVGTLWMIPYFGMDGAFSAQVISWAADLAVSYVLYRKYYRKHEQLERIVRIIAAKNAR